MNDGDLPVTQRAFKIMEGDVRVLQKYFDTAASPWWKRLLFRLDGWGPWYQLREKPAWRPWRRWYIS